VQGYLALDRVDLELVVFHVLLDGLLVGLFVLQIEADEAGEGAVLGLELLESA